MTTFSRGVYYHKGHPPMEIDFNSLEKEVMDSTQALITERGKTHGDFADHAYCTQLLKYAMEGFVCKGDDTPAWSDLTPAQKESLSMIAHKIGRILAGDANYRDHWDDIAGYARLVADRCHK